MIRNSPNKHYDVIVIGGGMVGASFTLALAAAVKPSRLSILVVDGSSLNVQQGDTTNFDARSTAISYGSSLILKDAGLWDGVSPFASAIAKIHVSDRGHFGSAQLDCEDYDIEALGYVVENQQIGSVLAKALTESESVTHLGGAMVSEIKPKSEGMLLEIKTGDQETHLVSTNLAVLADGGRSPLCAKLGIAMTTKDYGQHGLIANIAFSKPHHNQAFERFTESGPLAVLPLASIEGENRASLVWTVLENDVERLMAMEQSLLLKTLQESFGDRLGALTRVGKLSHYPLSLNQAAEQVRPGLVLLGNVAHTLHPVAGQGLNLALRDSRTLIACLCEAKVQGSSLGELGVLQRYLDQRSQDQRATIAATDGLVRLFSSNQLSKVLARKIGLISLELAPPMKKRFAHQAMGLAQT